MKDNIDVFQLQVQRDKNRNRGPPVDYKEHDSTYYGVRFIHEIGMKLNASPLVVSTAAVLYHKFFKDADSSNYDRFLIASTCVYLAGKVKDEPVKVRDVINVSRNTLHRNSVPLDLGDEYWNMRDSIVQGELLVMRMLKFEVTIIHPHKYMLHYLKSLQTWIYPEEWKKVPIVHMAYSFLQDFHYSPAILDYKAQHVAIACINLTLQVYGVQIPYTDEDEGITWYSVFVDDLTKDHLWEIMENIMDIYEKESETG
ncbi:cyclin-Q [Macrosteles quadrilineatus]|uniref:cyclin-Q n=1 Tax=Macrosteles quadrilineatus TaxID=74068 RepID=UPI0023E17107|nr:cyclin-Q [Macrosteles quadrilineatus]XP_054278448.1 cyclin-Q [Macrosteles quadrilineatus]